VSAKEASMKPFATTIPGYQRLGESRRYKKLNDD
jgi:hypothetical protein